MNREFTAGTELPMPGQHEFQFKRPDDLPSTGYMVVRVSNVPHMPGNIYSHVTTARKRAEELAIRTGYRFAVLAIVGICRPVKSPVMWEG